MSLRALVLSLGFGLAIVVGVGPGGAQTVPQADVAAQAVNAERVVRLSDTLKMGAIMDVMRQEGIEYGKTLETDLFPGRGGDSWGDIVAGVYDAARMRLEFDAALNRELAGAASQLTDIEAFFGSEQGQRILTLEVEARRALLDQAVEDAAKVGWEDLEAEGKARADQLRRFAQVNDLIESNVMGALNANLAFYRGLSTAGGLVADMTEEDMLRDVWDQEPSVRQETEDWLFPFLSLAYQPLLDADLDAYIAFSETPAGQRMNAALFVAFDSLFTRISFDLGAAAAIQMQGDDI
jgi:hypothetical protein